MVRPAIGTLIVVVGLAIAARASAELPMSPVFRTDQTTSSGKASLTEHANPTGPKTDGAAQAAVPKAAKPSLAAKATAANAGQSKVVATALIPPPPAPAPAPAEPAAIPSPTAPAEHAADRPHPSGHPLRRHYAYSRYPYLYRYYSAWNAWSAGSAAHLGPNPYSPNGGD